MRIFIFVLAFTCLQAYGKTLPTEADAKSLAEDIMQDVGSNKMKEGLEKLRPYIVFPTAEFDVQMNSIDMQMPIISQRFGNARCFDFIAKETLGDSLVQYSYLQKFDKHVMIWRFIFYKSGNEWLLNTFYFDDNVKSLFKY
jgi:hypothetical protein